MPQKPIKGSAWHMLGLVSSPDFEKTVNELLKGTGASVAHPNLRQPRGSESNSDWEEYELEKYLSDLPCPEYKVIDREWWLLYKTNVNRRPIWDLLCLIEVNGKRGLLLIEAKAHIAELKEQDCKSRPTSTRSEVNDERIRRRICETNLSLNKLGIGEFLLTADDHYQLANRLAYLNKLASEGVPTVLMYLGWTESQDWPTDPIQNQEHWHQLMAEHTSKVIPSGFIEQKFPTAKGGSMQMVIRSLQSPNLHRT